MGEVATAARPIDFEALLDFCKSESPRKGDFILEGYVATSDLDLQGDIILPEALKSAAKDLEKNSTVLDNHDPNKRVGAVLLSEARPGGLFVRIRISETVPHICKQIEEDVINKFSIRGRVIDAEQRYDPELKRFVTIIRKMYLTHCSVVSVPANTEARSLRHYIVKALEVKGMGEKEEKEKEEKEKAEKEKAEREKAEREKAEKEKAEKEKVEKEKAEKEKVEKEKAEEVSADALIMKAELSAEGFKRISALLDTIKAGTTDANALAAIETIKAMLGKVSAAAVAYPAPAQKTEEKPQIAATNPEVEKTLGEVVEGITKIAGVMNEIKDSFPRMGLRKSHIDVGGVNPNKDGEGSKDVYARLGEAIDELLIPEAK